MMTSSFSALPALLLALAACEPLPAADPIPGQGNPDTCGAAGAAEFVGQDESVIFATLFTAPIRVIRPGDVVTMEFNPQRLNFEVDAQGRVTRVYCG